MRLSDTPLPANLDNSNVVTPPPDASVQETAIGTLIAVGGAFVLYFGGVSAKTLSILGSALLVGSVVRQKT